MLTEKYENKKSLAYLVNYFLPVEIREIVNQIFVDFDVDMCTLRYLLKWIEKSQIYNGKPIDIYIPSERMRNLLIGWIKECKIKGELR